MDLFLQIVGVLLIVEGIPWFGCARGFKNYLRQVLELPDALLRAIGFCSMLCGLFLVYLSRL